MSSYDDYIETINKIEEIEEVIIKDSKTKRCCKATLEILKIILENIRCNINAKQKEKENKRS